MNAKQKTQADLKRVAAHNHLVDLRGNVKWYRHVYRVTRITSLTLLIIMALITIFTRIFLFGVALMVIILMAGYCIMVSANAKSKAARHRLGNRYHPVKTFRIL